MAATVFKDRGLCLPLAAGTGRSTSVALSHGASGGGKGGGADGTEGSRLGESCAKHRGREGV